ncbi:hypothetical protein GCM10010174_85490 [Kutzneria viridogrisea]|uniref:Membrane protein YdbS with pleckstrin-like domain n=1 Tax=Kutzneria viridogrisea TaxID=47990 RepID=A0ABR6BA08_9PSEU|nr:membrane protein YdbS with pleckstrin-like domain [Kutzneria viridogrisea]
MSDRHSYWFPLFLAGVLLLPYRYIMETVEDAALPAGKPFTVQDNRFESPWGEVTPNSSLAWILSSAIVAAILIVATIWWYRRLNRQGWHPGAVAIRAAVVAVVGGALLTLLADMVRNGREGVRLAISTSVVLLVAAGVLFLRYHHLGRPAWGVGATLTLAFAVATFLVSQFTVSVLVLLVAVGAAALAWYERAIVAATASITLMALTAWTARHIVSSGDTRLGFLMVDQAPSAVPVLSNLAALGPGIVLLLSSGVSLLLRARAPRAA